MPNIINPPTATMKQDFTSPIWQNWFLRVAVAIRGTIKQLPYSVTVPASGAAFQNTNPFPIDVIITGGTVTAISISRDGTNYYNIGVTSGIVNLSPLDYLEVTYSATPTITGIPR